MSSKTWLQVYLRSVWRLGGTAVAFGSDINGDSHTGKPRYGPKTCNGDAWAALQGNMPQTQPLLYAPIDFPSDQPVPIPSAVSMGFLDYHPNGLEHIGRYPEFVEDLVRLRLTREQDTPLFRSADAYARIRERIVK